MCEDDLLECHGPPYQKRRTDLASQAMLSLHDLLKAAHRRQFSRRLSLSSGIYDTPTDEPGENFPAQETPLLVDRPVSQLV